MQRTGEPLQDGLEAIEESLSPAAERTEALIDTMLSMLPLLVVAVVGVVLFWAVGRFLGTRRFLIARLSRGSELIEELLRRVIPLVFLALGIIFALNVLDAVAILSAMLGAAGVVGIAVGFAIRDTIENFIASVMLSIRQPFRAKDFVEIDGREGIVVSLTSRATILMTIDGNHLRIPNAQVFKAIITNYTRNPERRISFTLGIDAADDPRAAMDAGLAKLAGLPFILDDPSQQAWIEEVGDSNILVTYAFWIDQRVTDFLKARSAAIRIAKIELEEQGFTLPEPIYRLRIDQVPDALTAIVHQAEGLPASGEAKKKEPPRVAKDMIGDTAPDTAIEEKVDEDRAKTGGEDLLSDRQPTEFGDEGSLQTNKARLGG
ncbi:MAG: mechanosensitive ion channel domain-containing protein [Parvularcula sp.]|jgi:small-conductance mechanosensitive channel|nr:mechanosensitive ion channel domain-containing protein [Parvularcula sp.]